MTDLKTKDFSHTLHSKGFSPVCTFKCIFKRHFLRNALLHILQIWDFFLLCISSDFFSSHFWVCIFHGILTYTYKLKFLGFFTYKSLHFLSSTQLYSRVLYHCIFVHARSIFPNNRHIICFYIFFSSMYIHVKVKNTLTWWNSRFQQTLLALSNDNCWYILLLYYIIENHERGEPEIQLTTVSIISNKEKFSREKRKWEIHAKEIW